jgi:transcription elongation factor Elf1
VTARHPSTTSAGLDRKSVLFCLECGHESHVAGDWVVRDDGRRTTYECPECDATVTTRVSADPVAP